MDDYVLVVNHSCYCGELASILEHGEDCLVLHLIEIDRFALELTEDLAKVACRAHACDERVVVASGDLLLVRRLAVEEWEGLGRNWRSGLGYKADLWYQARHLGGDGPAGGQQRLQNGLASRPPETHLSFTSRSRTLIAGRRRPAPTRRPSTRYGPRFAS